MGWSKGIVEWVEDDTAYISIAFSWLLPDVYQRAIWYKTQGYKVRAGGPGTFLNKNYLDGVAEMGGAIDAVVRHNPNATFASRGCPVGCSFCIVPPMEGKKFTLLPEFIPRPILCDSNLSALPVEYQDYIIEKYQKYNVTLEDANSGFEPQTFDEDTYHRWDKINKGAWRFAYDESKEEAEVFRMVNILKDVYRNKKRVYVLIGNEPFESCYRRIMQVIEWGCEPHVQPMVALNTLKKRPLIRFDWTDKKLKNLTRWANRWLWRTILFDEYNP